jgi:hypothetical protein
MPVDDHRSWKDRVEEEARKIENGNAREVPELAAEIEAEVRILLGPVEYERYRANDLIHRSRHPRPMSPEYAAAVDAMAADIHRRAAELDAADRQQEAADKRRADRQQEAADKRRADIRAAVDGRRDGTNVIAFPSRS